MVGMKKGHRELARLLDASRKAEEDSWVGAVADRLAFEGRWEWSEAVAVGERSEVKIEEVQAAKVR